jgi:preprotein translocase subunit Sss1
MKMTRLDWILLPFLIGALALLTAVMFALVGFLGLGILGLLIGVMAQRIEIEKDGATSGNMTTSLYAEQFRAREAMSRAERAEHRARSANLLNYLHVAKIVSAGLVILGFGFFALFQL